MSKELINNDPTVTVVPGEISVSVIDRVLDLPTARAWNIDLHSKYARVLSYSQGGDVASVHLYATEDTLHVVKELRQQTTAIRIQVPDDWIIMAEAGRYTCRIVAYKPTFEEPTDEQRNGPRPG